VKTIVAHRFILNKVRIITVANFFPFAMSAEPHTRYTWQQSTRRKTFNVNLIRCPHLGCSRLFKNRSGLTQHRHAIHGFSFNIPTTNQNLASEYASPLLPQTDADDTGCVEDLSLEGAANHEYHNTASPDLEDNPTQHANADEVYRDYHLQLNGTTRS